MATDGSGERTSAPTRRFLLIANPTAGGFNQKTLEIIVARLEAAGHRIRLHLTQRAGEIGETCADPSLSADVVVVAGGDGSINEAITGFGGRLNPPALAVVPFGTANVLAQELRLPFKAARIADMILRDRRQPLHYGLANGHPFVLMASAGFDAAVVHALPLDLKRRWGKLAYVMTAVRLAFSRQEQAKIEVEANGSVVRCRLAVVTNGKCYGGPFVICPQAAVSNPGLHLVALERDDIASSIRAGLALVTGRLHKAKGVIHRAVTGRVEIRSTSLVPAQIDGDPFGTTPLVVEEGERPISIVVP